MSPADDEDVAVLVAAERLREAAALSFARGDAARAVALLERASLPSEAADVAEAAGDLPKAVRLAADAGDRARLGRLAEAVGVADAARLARDLEGARRPLGAAIMFERAGDDGNAAKSWAAAGEAVQAATAFVRFGDDRGAARVLGDRLTEQPGDAGAAFALARLCARHARWEAAATALQRAAEHGPLGEEASAFLARALSELGVGPYREDVPAAPAGATPERALLFGRWEALGEIAASPTARVLSALDRLTGARVAVKLLRPAAGAEGRDAIARLEREARALALLRHPRVVPLVAWVPEGPALVLAWMAGGSLADLLLHGPLSPARASEIARAVLEALAAAHRIGIVHRDVKPANVLFDAAAAPHLADFGAAHVGDAAATVTAGLIGTLGYMAPEQREGRPAGTASDVYAVGALLLESLTGSLPGPGAARPSEVSPALSEAHDALLATLLATAPEDRPASAEDALTAIVALPWPDVKPSPPAERAESTRPAARRRFRANERGDAFDELLERRVALVPIDDASRALARAFARAEDDTLAAVLAVDADAGIIVVEVPPGRPLARALNDAEAHAVARALAALHREGVAHGRVDAGHVIVDETRGVTLAFPSTRDPSANAALDLADLGRLHA